ncbi:DUF5924 family protein [Halomonas sp. Bachu 37]|uniref:DUF5924 family protein n=1 Tax=Halomonas kashgarensis TaxID=3084920 RepID=UPI003216BF33
MKPLITANRLAQFQDRVEQFVTRLRPWSWLWPPMAFGAGLGSFFLVDRQQWLGAALALGLMFAWVLLLSESMIGRFLAHRGYPTLPGGVTAFIAQMIHQETLFFTLPFVLATTVWNSGQVIFTVLVATMALISIVDPLYFRMASRSRSLFFVFHAHCVFLVVLVTLPIMLHLSTGQSLIVAIIAMVVFTLPSVLHLLKQHSFTHWGILVVLSLTLASVAWMGRIWVPPASLWMTGHALAPALDTERRAPEGSAALTPERLAQNGLYLYTAIRAPRGLSETITHEWHHEGTLIDSVELDIDGGREKGYRAWSHKLNFPEQPEGDWRIDIMTDSGQRIGLVRFTVSSDPEQATLADSHIQRTGLSRLNLRRLIPGQGDIEPE